MPHVTGGTRRGRPRLWHHDYLHLRPLARDLTRTIEAAVGEGPLEDVLDVGSGPSPYRNLFGAKVARYVRLDRLEGERPGVVARAEAMPFRDASFDAVLSTQLWGLVDEPSEVVREIVRVARPGARVWLSGPANWPYDSARAEHRFGAPDLPELVEGLDVVTILPEGGMVGLPFALWNIAVREATRAAERRLGVVGRFLRGPAVVSNFVSNLAGRALERLAAAGPLSGYLGYLDGRMPMNFLVVARKRS
jgi:SAM-dependent methyltransferase